MRRALVLLTLTWMALPAKAQTREPPEGLDYPSRAMALRPTGMTVQRFEWNTLMATLPTAGSHEPVRATAADYSWNEIEARIPYESLLIDVAAGANVMSSPLNGAAISTNNVEVGASFRDAPARGVRYELGGAVTVPTLIDATLASRPSSTGASGSPYPTLALRNILHQRGAGWDPQRFRSASFALVPHARIEVDPIVELALGLEVDVPILFDTNSGNARALPQVALEVAGRFEQICLAGVRAELTSSGFGGTPDTVSVALEPFVRLGLPFGRTASFVRLGLRIPFGPGYPFVTTEPFGLIGATLAAGVLY